MGEGSDEPSQNPDIVWKRWWNLQAVLWDQAGIPLVESCEEPGTLEEGEEALPLIHRRFIPRAWYTGRKKPMAEVSLLVALAKL